MTTFTEPAEVRARFDQRLPPHFFDRVQARVIERLVAAGSAAILTDDPEDVAYLTGFFHHPCERPVAVWLQADGRCVLLLPELEREHAEAQQARAELAVFEEYPGVRAPFAALADAVGPPPRGTKISFGSGISVARLTAAQDALGPADWRPSTMITEARYRKFDEEIALHAEAARITDLMITGGVELITDAITAGGQLPSEAELAAHITKLGTATMYVEGERMFVLGEFLRHRQGHGIGLGMHEPPWLEDGDPTLLEPGMIVSNEPGIYLPGHAGYRISDSMLVTADGSRPLTAYPRDLESCTIPV